MCIRDSLHGHPEHGRPPVPLALHLGPQPPTHLWRPVPDNPATRLPPVTPIRPSHPPTSGDPFRTIQHASYLSHLGPQPPTHLWRPTCHTCHTQAATHLWRRITDNSATLLSLFHTLPPARSHLSHLASRPVILVTPCSPATDPPLESLYGQSCNTPLTMSHRCPLSPLSQLGPQKLTQALWAAADKVLHICQPACRTLNSSH